MHQVRTKKQSHTAFQAKELGLDRPGIIVSLIIIQAIVLLPLWFQLPTWVALASASLLAMRYFIHKFEVSLPYWFVLILVIASVAAVFAQFKTISGRDAGISLIVLMYGFKLLESKTYRDAALLLFISFFIMVMAFLYKESIIMGLYLMVSVMAILLGLISLNSLHGVVGIKKMSRISGSVFLQTLPIMVVLFFLFPRLPGPLWAIPDNSQARSGISSSMGPGDISSLSLSNEPAFRVKFNGAVPTANELYWRGLVMSEFDGFTWREGPRGVLSTPPQIPYELTYQYEVQLEPTDQRFIFGLEQLATAPEGLYTFTDMTWRRANKVTSRFQYQAQAQSYDYSGMLLSRSQRNINLQLPEQNNQRTIEWAENLFAQSRDQRDFINKVLQHIANQEYYYTLTPEIIEDQSIIDGFWFDSREGFCEHYASSFVFIMRAVGIAARVVTGYQGGEYNPYGDYYLIRQSDAHAWTEVWIDNLGWQRVDPTAAIDPSRVQLELSEQLRSRDSWFSDAVSAIDVSHGFLAKLKMRWDAIENYWNESLMGYDQESQNNWLSKLGVDNQQWRYLVYAIMGSVLLFALLFGLWIIKKSKHQDPVIKIFIRLEKKLKAKGFEMKANEGPQAAQLRLERELPEVGQIAKPVIDAYIALRYRSVLSSKAAINKFDSLVKGFK